MRLILQNKKWGLCLAFKVQIVRGWNREKMTGESILINLYVCVGQGRGQQMT